MSSRKSPFNDPAQRRFRERQTALPQLENPCTGVSIPYHSVRMQGDPIIGYTGKKSPFTKPVEYVPFPEWEELAALAVSDLGNWVWHWQRNVKFIRPAVAGYKEQMPQALSLIEFIKQRVEDWIREYHRAGPKGDNPGFIYKWGRMKHNSVAGHMKKRIAKATRKILEEFHERTAPRSKSDHLWYHS